MREGGRGGEEGRERGSNSKHIRYDNFTTTVD